MVKLNSFDILSQKVSSLLTRFKELKDENKDLKLIIKDNDKKIKLLENKIAADEKEKKDIKAKIEKIIDKIEELEVG